MKLTKEQRSERARKAAFARADKLTSEQRKAIAAKGGKAKRSAESAAKAMLK